MKKAILFMIVFVMVGLVNAALVSNGSFDVDAADWNTAGGGTWAPGHVIDAGNGYLTLDVGVGGWGVWYQAILENLDEWGIPAGTTVTMSVDIKETGTGGLDSVALKMESWQDGGVAAIGEYEEVLWPDVTHDWATYSFEYPYTIDPSADAFKCIVVHKGYSTAEYAFDNIEILIPGGTPALKPVPFVGGGIAPANAVISWVNPAGAINADVYVLESATPLTSPDPRTGTKVATGTTAESLDLSAAGFTVVSDKYYYWAVDVNTGSVVAGFTWDFQTLDAPPTNISAGLDQYVWLAGGTRQFTLTGTYSDDAESAVTELWEDLSNPDEQAPGTTVTINSPGSSTTTVDVDGDGWFLFRFAVSDAVGSDYDEVNVGVYVDACAAAKADPTDIDATYPNGNGDIDGDCDTDLVDFALLAASWMNCMSDKLLCGSL